jgi:phage terminase large subunit-like protein
MINEDFQRLRKLFQSKSLDERKAFLKACSQQEQLFFFQNPDLFLFDKQIINSSSRYIILRCGRRFGKSIAGSAWIAKAIMAGETQLGICGVSYQDVKKIMVPNIIAWFPPHLHIKYNNQDHTLSGFPNNAIVHCFSSENEIRGYGLSKILMDEVGSWSDCIPEKVKERFDILDFACSAGDNPQILITSTPRPFPLFIEWQNRINAGDKNYHLITGNMYDNPFLSDAYKKAIHDKFGSGRFGRQELYGELLEDVEGALWTQQMISDAQMSKEQFIAKLNDKNERFYLIQTIVSVDPSISNNPSSDECGIIVAALGSDYNAYLLDDLSGQMSTNDWAKQAIKAYHRYECNKMIMEKNQGGDLVKTNITSLDNSIRVKLINSSKGKIDRAAPVAALYERNLIHHVQLNPSRNTYEKLENQQTHWAGLPRDRSADRMDAAVFAISDFLLKKEYCERDISNIGGL